MGFVGTPLQSQTVLASENFFLRKQMAMYGERQAKLRRASDPTGLALVLLAQCFPWHEALMIVQPATIVRWSREAFRLFWHERPRLPVQGRYKGHVGGGDHGRTPVLRIPVLGGRICAPARSAPCCNFPDVTARTNPQCCRPQSH